MLYKNIYFSDGSTAFFNPLLKNSKIFRTDIKNSGVWDPSKFVAQKQKNLIKEYKTAFLLKKKRK